MSLNSRASGHNCLGFWISELLLLLLLTPASEVAGQTAPSPAAKNLAIESHFTAAQQAQHDKDYSTAEREYRAVLALAPDFAEVHMNLGLVYQLQDRSDEAMAEFRRALKVKPGLTGANFFLAGWQRRKRSPASYKPKLPRCSGRWSFNRRTWMFSTF